VAERPQPAHAGGALRQERLPGGKAGAENRRRELGRVLVSAARHESARRERAQPAREELVRPRPKREPARGRKQFHASPRATALAQLRSALRRRRSQLLSESSELLLVSWSRQSKASPQRSMQRRSSFRSTPELMGDCMNSMQSPARSWLMSMVSENRVITILATARRRPERTLSPADHRYR
jgi:hypothetical protein